MVAVAQVEGQRWNGSCALIVSEFKEFSTDNLGWTSGQKHIDALSPLPLFVVGVIITSVMLLVGVRNGTVTR